MHTGRFINRLKKLVEGLLYFSESEYPYIIHQTGVVVPGMFSLKLSELAGSEMKSEEIDSKLFFQKCIRNASLGNDRISKIIANKYKELHTLLLDKELKTSVWRIGNVQVHIFICIQDKDNDLILLHTKAIET